MKFMLIVKATADTEAGVMPDTELLTAMGAYNEELVKAGVLLAGEGLHPSSRGARVYFDGRARRVVDGPFAEAKELIAGYWLSQARSLEEALEWVKRVPNLQGEQGQIEVRQLFDPADFGDELTPELRAAEASLREQVAGRPA
ncbi:YciI family protein [Lysobacter sp. 2RAB21]